MDWYRIHSMSHDIWKHFVVLCVDMVIRLLLVVSRGSFAHIFRISRAGTSNYTPHLLWNVVTYPCPWFLLFAQHSPNQPPTHNKAVQKQTLCMSYWHSRHLTCIQGVNRNWECTRIRTSADWFAHMATKPLVLLIFHVLHVKYVGNYSGARCVPGSSKWFISMEVDIHIIWSHK